MKIYTDKDRKNIQRKLANIDGYEKIANKIGKKKDAVKMIFTTLDRYNKEAYDAAIEVIQEYTEEVEKQKQTLMPLVK